MGKDVLIKNDIVGHRKLLDNAVVMGLTKVNIPISWIRDLLIEIEELRKLTQHNNRLKMDNNE